MQNKIIQHEASLAHVFDTMCGTLPGTWNASAEKVGSEIPNLHVPCHGTVLNT